MVVNFEVGKKYRYNGKIGDPSPFVAIGIEEQDALFIVSGEPLVCTYVENHSCPFIKFEGMSSARGWAFTSLYHLFDEVVEDPYVPVKISRYGDSAKMKLYKVLNKDLTSPFQGFQFELNKKYVCEDFDTSTEECSRGFYATDFNGLAYSLNQGGKKHSVFEVEVGGKSREFNQFKRRFEEITILRQLSEDEIKTSLLACEEAEGYKVLEVCYPVNPFTIEPIPLEEALVLLEQWDSIWDSVATSVWDSVRDSVRDSAWGSVWGSVERSIGDSVRTLIWDLIWDSVWGSVGDSVRASAVDSVWAYTSSLFPNVKKWEYFEHAKGVNPFQSCIDLWRGGYVPSFDGHIWRLHTKNGIAWDENKMDDFRLRGEKGDL